MANGKSTNSEIAILQTQMEEVKVSLLEINRKLDDLGGKYLTREEFAAYRMLLEPGQHIKRRITDTAVSALTYGLIIGAVLVLMTYVSQMLRLTHGGG